jgi:hypothetical protein
LGCLSAVTLDHGAQDTGLDPYSTQRGILVVEETHLIDTQYRSTSIPNKKTRM